MDVYTKINGYSIANYLCTLFPIYAKYYCLLSFNYPLVPIPF